MFLTEREWNILRCLVSERYAELKRQENTRDEKAYSELVLLKEKLNTEITKLKCFRHMS